MYLELQFVLLVNHNQNNVFSLFQTCSKSVYCRKVGISFCRNEKTVSTFFDQSKLRLDQSKIRSERFFLQNSNSALF